MSGLNRIKAGELTVKKLKGKALVKALGKEFSPESLLEANRTHGNNKKNKKK